MISVLVIIGVYLWFKKYQDETVDEQNENS